MKALGNKVNIKFANKLVQSCKILIEINFIEKNLKKIKKKHVLILKNVNFIVEKTKKLLLSQKNKKS